MLDYLFILGCNLKGDLARIHRLCEGLKIQKYLVLGDGVGAVDLEDARWAELGVGEQTHVMALAHGGVENTKHCMQLHPEDDTRSIDVVETLCSMQVGTKPDGSPVRRKGLTCIFACYVGLLVDELVAKPAVVANCPVIVYGRAYGTYEGEDILEGMEHLIRETRAPNRDRIHWPFLATHWLTREEMSLLLPGCPALRLSAAETCAQLQSGQDILEAVVSHCANEETRARPLAAEKRSAVAARVKVLRDTLGPLKELIAQTNSKTKTVSEDIIDRNLQILVSSGDGDRFLSFIKTIPSTIRPDPCVVVRGLAESLRFSEQIAKYLLAGKFFVADGEQVPSYDMTPLTSAAGAGNLVFLDLLLLSGANPRRTGIRKKSTPLLLAAKKGHTDLVRRLCQPGLDPGVDLPDNAGRTALFFAVGESNLEITRLLLDRGATVGEGGQGSLVWNAVSRDLDEETTSLTTTEIVRLLLAKRPVVPASSAPQLPKNFVAANGVAFYPSYGPTKTSIGQNSTLGQRTMIKSGCAIGHDSKIGADIVIGPDATLGDRVEIDDHSFVAPGARIDARVRVGRNTAILDHARIGEGVVIGNGVRINRRVVFERQPSHKATTVETNAIIDDDIVIRSNPEGNVIKLNWWVTAEGIFSHDGGNRGDLIFAQRSREYQRTVGRG